MVCMSLWCACTMVCMSRAILNTHETRRLSRDVPTALHAALKYDDDTETTRTHP
jgi:hypothetical protein